MNTKQNIFLIGPMGAGKTTIGRYLASQLQREFYDTDQVIEDRTGVDVAWIFDVEGEPGFRERERLVLDEFTQKAGVVLATGGGVILDSENRQNLRARGVVVYLQVAIDEQLERTEKDKRRPLLETDDKRTKLETLTQQRNDLYQEIADYTFNTNSRSVKAVAGDVLEQLNNHH